ncbi:MAG: hypothetical protein GY819_12005 [Planctomycetaceae bacterium]|nr:hypothetical protein [Planctomycetaceae bacterium]MDG1806291.1 hypothetical protein [Pirellulaceae bacterium]MDG2103221.1 hypothetical protein [Pirellulaceae bacterium]
MHAETSTSFQNILFMIMTPVFKAGAGDRTLDIQLGKLTNSPVSSLSGAKRSGSEIAQNQNDSHLATTDKDSDPLRT